jgi:hypothetical protein
MRVVLRSILAGRAGVPPTDESVDLGNARLGIFVADLPGSRDRKAGL